MTPNVRRQVAPGNIEDGKCRVARKQCKYVSASLVETGAQHDDQASSQSGDDRTDATHTRVGGNQLSAAHFEEVSAVYTLVLSTMRQAHPGESGMFSRRISSLRLKRR